MNNGTYGIIDGLNLRNYAPQTWQFDGGYITLDANGAATSWNYYVTDHLGSTRKVIANTNTVKETINYYPYGSEMTMTSPSLNVDSNWQPFRFSGKELDKLNGLNMYDFGARWFDVAGVPAWTSVDPLAEDNYPVTPYSYCNGDPVNLIDPNGESTYVTKDDNGLYMVIGGNLYDDDLNVYLYYLDKNGEYTIRGEVVGQTLFMTSFYNSDINDWVYGAIVNPGDFTGIDFFKDMKEKNISLVDYILNARSKHKYDFKSTNGTTVAKYNDMVQHYRGMPFEIIPGKIRYASARDIGNLVAGYKAGAAGLDWELTKKAFDAYESISQRKLTKEGSSTRNAEKYGFMLGRHSLPMHGKNKIFNIAVLIKSIF